MPYTKTTWVDRLVQFPNRFTKAGETSTGVTLTANPGIITQAGTPISAANMNKIENGIANAVEKTGDTMTGDLTVAANVNVVGDGYGASLYVNGNVNAFFANFNSIELAPGGQIIIYDLPNSAVSATNKQYVDNVSVGSQIYQYKNIGGAF